MPTGSPKAAASAEDVDQAAEVDHQAAINYHPEHAVPLKPILPAGQLQSRSDPVLELRATGAVPPLHHRPTEHCPNLGPPH